MPSHRERRQGPPAYVPASDRPHFDANDALTWPFPESRGSPVWQAWRAERDADRIELNAKGWAAVGLHQVMASRARRHGRVRQRRNEGEPADALQHDGAAARDAVTGGSTDRGFHADRLDLHFGAQMAQRLRRAALETLGDVAVAHSSGRQWWALAPGIGPRRAREIVERVRSLLEPGA
jgi:hypothetical protein